MKRGLLIFFCLISLWGCQEKGAENPMERIISKKFALEDFKVFTSILKSSHPSLNIYISPQKFDLLLDSMQQTIKADIGVNELFNKYAYIVNEIGCSHTYMNIPKTAYDSLLDRKFFFPIPVKLIENRLIVNATSLTLTEGTEIISINQKPVSEILKNIMIYETVEGFHRSTQKKLAAESFALNYFYTYGKAESFDLLVTDTTGKEESIKNIPSTTLGKWYDYKESNIYYYDRTECDYDLYINDKRKYALLRIGTFSFDSGEKQDAFRNFCKNSFELLSYRKDIGSIVIDLRENLGGDLYNSSLLFSYLAREDFKEYHSASSKIDRIKNAEYLDKKFLANGRHSVDERLLKEYYYNNKTNSYLQSDSLIGNWKPDKFAFKGNIYIITNAKVASAASYFSTMVKNSGIGKIIGEETVGGSFSGNAFTALNYILPYSDLQLIFPFGHIVYSYRDKKNTGSGVLPDFDIPDSYNSFKKNEDRQLKFIVDSLLSKK